MRSIELESLPDGTWTARCPDLPGYVARGKTREEAIQRIGEAIRIYDPCRCDT